MPQKSWAVGEEVLAADFNLYAQNQVVPQFTATAQRDSQWASPPNGALCVTTDTNTVWQRVSGAWQREGAGYQLAYAQTTASQTSIGATEVDLTGLSVTFTVPAGRRVALIADLFLLKDATNAHATVKITTSANVTVQQRNIWLATNAQAPVRLEIRLSPAAGTYTYKARALCSQGSMQTLADPTYPLFMAADDLT